MNTKGSDAAPPGRKHKKNAAPILLALLITLHFSGRWTPPTVVAAATPAPGAQVTFIPDVLPLEVEGSQPAAADLQTLPQESSAADFELQQLSAQPYGPVAVQPDTGSTRLGYAYEIRDGLTLIHLWKDGQVISVNALDPGLYGTIEQFKSLVGQHIEYKQTSKSWIWKGPLALALNYVEYTLLQLTGAAALASCLATPLTGIAAIGCAGGAFAFLGEAAVFSLARFERQMEFNDAARQFREHQAALADLQNTWASMMEITSRREEP